MQTSVIYARVSSVGDRQNTERQIIDLKEYADYAKLDVKQIFEEHISGACVARREGSSPFLGTPIGC